MFNIDRVSGNHECVYIFEGPINAFFTKNSVAVAGITERGRSFTQRQEEQLNTRLKFFDKTWILDSQWVDQASLIKSEVLLKQGERVFIWPEKFGKRFKDFGYETPKPLIRAHGKEIILRVVESFKLIPSDRIYIVYNKILDHENYSFKRK